MLHYVVWGVIVAWFVFVALVGYSCCVVAGEADKRAGLK